MPDSVSPWEISLNLVFKYCDSLCLKGLLLTVCVWGGGSEVSRTGGNKRKASLLLETMPSSVDVCVTLLIRMSAIKDVMQLALLDILGHHPGIQNAI